MGANTDISIPILSRMKRGNMKLDLSLDYHAHILPGCDHGSDGLATSLKQVEMAASAGVKTICATPHFYPHKESVESFLRRRKKTAGLLLRELPENAPLIQLGAEVLICDGMERLDGLNRLCREGTNELLLEMPFYAWPESIWDTLYLLCDLADIQIVLAHAERYPAENIEKLICESVPLQLNTTETDVDILAANIRTKYLGVDYGTLNSVGHSFTDTDLYGDMDAFYLTTEMNRGGVALSTIIENYFTAGLTDASRASYFLTNRLGGMVTKDGIRSKVLSTYTGNTLIGALESSYSLTDLPNCETLRKACCYAFADYLFDLAGDPNGTDPVDPDPVDPDPKPEPKPDNAYYSVFSSDTTTVAPGVTQTINYALTKDDKQIVYYIATADIAREDVSIHANYHDNDPSQGWAMSRVSDQMAAAQKRHSDPSDAANYVEHYNAVVGVNADFYNMTTGAPQRRSGYGWCRVSWRHLQKLLCDPERRDCHDRRAQRLRSLSGSDPGGCRWQRLSGQGWEACRDQCGGLL